MKWRGFLIGAGVAAAWITGGLVLVDLGLTHDWGSWTPIVSGLVIGAVIAVVFSSPKDMVLSSPKSTVTQRKARPPC